MTKPQITGVHVDTVNYDATNAAAGFTFKGHRYHIWFNPQTVATEAVLHKNPVKEEPRETRRSQHIALNPNAKANAPMLAEMWRQIKEGNMIAEAIRLESYEQVRHQAEIENSLFDMRIRFRARALEALRKFQPTPPLQGEIDLIVDAMEWAREQ